MALLSKTLMSLSAVALFASLAFSQPAAAAMDEAQKKEMGDFIKDYLISHPELMLDVQAALEKKQAEQQADQSNKVISENKAAIFDSTSDVNIGNAKGDVTVVEFFDYNCGYCRHALSDTDTLLKNDKNIRYVLKEFPILGPDSVAASKVSDAFRKLAPDKYPQFSHALLSSDGRATEDTAIEIAGNYGVKEDALRKEMAASPNTDTIKATYQLATDLGVTGTPAYVIGNEAVSGAIGLDALKEKVANVRACGKTSC